MTNNLFTVTFEVTNEMPDGALISNGILGIYSSEEKAYVTIGEFCNQYLGDEDISIRFEIYRTEVDKEAPNVGCVVVFDGSDNKVVITKNF